MLTFALLLTANALLINSRPMDPFKSPESSTWGDLDALDGFGRSLPPQYKLEEFGRYQAYPDADFFNFDDLERDHQQEDGNIGGNDPVPDAPWQYVEREYATYQRTTRNHSRENHRKLYPHQTWSALVEISKQRVP